MPKGRQGLTKLGAHVAVLQTASVRTLTTDMQRMPLSDWMRARARVLRRDRYCCVECVKLGLAVKATEVDHIVPLAEGGSNDDANLQSLCKVHHARKSNDEAARRRL